MTRLVGLTGGIGSGKSTVARVFAKLGAEVVCADAIVRELQAPGTPLVRQLAEAFGPEILTEGEALDREALAAIVFRDPEARERLGHLVHPPVGVEMARLAAAARADHRPLVVVDIPLLFEGRRRGRRTGSALDLEATILAWAPVETQIERTMRRDACSRTQAERRIAAQLPIDEKRSMADHVIDNSGRLEHTEDQVRRLFQRLTRARTTAPSGPP